MFQPFIRNLNCLSISTGLKFYKNEQAMVTTVNSLSIRYIYLYIQGQAAKSSPNYDCLKHLNRLEFLAENLTKFSSNPSLVMIIKYALSRNASLPSYSLKQNRMLKWVAPNTEINDVKSY